MNHENAPATKLLATNCACCGRALTDAVSVETGIGPECRKRFAVDVVVEEAKRVEANQLVWQVARRGMRRNEAAAIFNRLAELGFTVLADRIAKRFRAKVEQGPSAEECRVQYAKVRADFCYDNCTPLEFNLLVKSTNPQTPAQWVEHALEAACGCKRCAGTGRFITMTENGQPKGPGGICFRCEGRGYQVLADAHRNRAFDQYNMARVLRAG